MLKRTLIVIAVALGVVFVPYYVAPVQKFLWGGDINEFDKVQTWLIGVMCITAIVCAIGLVIFIPISLYNYIRYGK